ncbi:hypothetical protein FKM82_021516 [Ascaphus truei]
MKLSQIWKNRSAFFSLSVVASTQSNVNILNIFSLHSCRDGGVLCIHCCKIAFLAAIAIICFSLLLSVWSPAAPSTFRFIILKIAYSRCIWIIVFRESLQYSPIRDQNSWTTGQFHSQCIRSA